jgi:hypothetical protein
MARKRLRPTGEIRKLALCRQEKFYHFIFYFIANPKEFPM